MAKRKIVRGRISRSPEYKQALAKSRSKEKVRAVHLSQESDSISDVLVEVGNMDFKDASPANLLKITAALADALNRSLKQRVSISSINDAEKQEYLQFLDQSLLMVRNGFGSVLQEIADSVEQQTIGDALALEKASQQIKDHIETIEEILGPQVEPLFDDLRKWLEKEYSEDIVRKITEKLEAVDPAAVARLSLSEQQNPKELLDLQQAILDLKDDLAALKGSKLPEQYQAGMDSIVEDAGAKFDSMLKELNKNDPLVKELQKRRDSLAKRLDDQAKADDKALQEYNDKRKTRFKKMMASINAEAVELSMEEMKARKSEKGLSSIFGKVDNLGKIGEWAKGVKLKEGSMLDKLVGDYFHQNDPAAETQKEIDKVREQLDKRFTENEKQVTQQIAETGKGTTDKLQDEISQGDTADNVSQVETSTAQILSTLESTNRLESDRQFEFGRKQDSIQEQMQKLNDASAAINTRMVELEKTSKEARDEAKKAHDEAKKAAEAAKAGGGGDGGSLLDDLLDGDGKKKKGKGGKGKGGKVRMPKGKGMSLGTKLGIAGTVLTVGAGAIAYSQADSTAEKKDVVGETGGALAGGLVGAKAGAAGGAAIGAFFGGVGAVPGAFIGGLVGGTVGAVAGSSMGKWVSSLFKNPEDEIPDEVKSRGPDAQLAYLEKVLNPKVMQDPSLGQEEKQKIFKRLQKYAEQLNTSGEPTDFVPTVSDVRILSDVNKKGVQPSFDELRKKYRTLTSDQYDQLMSRAKAEPPKTGAVKPLIPAAWAGAENLGKKIEPEQDPGFFSGITAGLGKAWTKTKEVASNVASTDIVEQAQQTYAQVKDAGSFSEAAQAISSSVSDVASGKVTKEAISGRKASLLDEMTKAGITDPNERAIFMAQVQTETGGLRKMSEGKYSADSVWRLRGKQLSALGVSKDQVDAAYKAGGASAMYEFMYSDKYRSGGSRMGNDQAGDAERYKGRGAFQLTGKKNYASMSKKIFGDDRLVKNPELAEQPDVSAKIAIQYWKDNGLGKYARAGDVDSVSAGINAGNVNADRSKVHGLADRRANYQKMMADASVTSAQPVQVAKAEVAPSAPPAPKASVSSPASAPTKTSPAAATVLAQSSQPQPKAPPQQPAQGSKIDAIDSKMDTVLAALSAQQKAPQGTTKHSPPSGDGASFWKRKDSADDLLASLSTHEYLTGQTARG